MSEKLASWITLEGCYNFRDLGGYHTEAGRTLRTGRVFRSDGLQHLTAKDLDHLVGTLRLGAVIDLRGDDEVLEDGSGTIVEREVVVHRVPLFRETRSSSARGGVRTSQLANMGELYFMMLEAAREPIARVVELLADSTVPTVFHCAAGKDRTGVISALLLSLAGVPEDTIVADYALSRSNIDQINARLAASGSYQRFMEDLPTGAYDADPEAMRCFLAKLRDRFGSVSGWAADAGIAAAIQQRLRSRLLD
jgi:protein tyrosine/serine phosphatase